MTTRNRWNFKNYFGRTERAILFGLILLLGRRVYAQGASNDEDVRQAFQQGERDTQSGDLVGAEKAFQRVLELVPGDVGARVNLGVICMREQRWDCSLHYLGQAQKLAPQVVGIRLNLGLVHYRQSQYAKAIPEFEWVLHKQPDSVQARRLLGLCYLFEARYADATDALQPLWDSASGDVSYLYSLAVAAGNAGRHDLEERAANQLMEKARDSPFVHLLLGKAYIAHEEYDKALAELQKASNGDSKLPMVHYNLGVVYRHEGDSKKARDEFLLDVGLEPAVAFNYDQLGLLASLDGNDAEAEGYFLAAVQRDPKLGTSWFGLAKTYKQEKRYSDALKALAEAGALDPKSASVHYLRAQVLSDIGRKSDAQVEYANVQRLKKAEVDTLEMEISGPKYRDGALPQ